MSNHIKWLLKEQTRIACELGDEVKAAYPIGAAIMWTIPARDDVLRGVVIDHGYRDRVKVRNNKTGTEYWIEAPRIA